MQTAELDERKSRILALIIESYIQTGEPVGSKALAEMLDNCVSSATIRNDMAALTAAGYLEQPHTSAGRLPTAKAFRLYIDRLMHRNPLPERDRNYIDRVLAALPATRCSCWRMPPVRWRMPPAMPPWPPSRSRRTVPSAALM